MRFNTLVFLKFYLVYNTNIEKNNDLEKKEVSKYKSNNYQKNISIPIFNNLPVTDIKIMKKHLNLENYYSFIHIDKKIVELTSDYYKDFIKYKKEMESKNSYQNLKFKKRSFDSYNIKNKGILNYGKILAKRRAFLAEKIFVIQNSIFEKFKKIQEFYFLTIRSDNKWEEKYKNISRNHLFLKDHDDYQYFSCPNLPNLCFYRRKKNYFNILVANRSAYIQRGFIFGKCVIIMGDCYIEKNVSIGDNSFISKSCSIGCFTSIGKGCILFNNVNVGSNTIICDNNVFGSKSRIGMEYHISLVNREEYKKCIYNRNNMSGSSDAVKVSIGGHISSRNLEVYIDDGNIFDSSVSLKKGIVILSKNYFGKFSNIFSFTKIMSYNFFYESDIIYSHTEIGSYNFLYANVLIEKHAHVGNFTTLKENTTIYKKCSVQNFFSN